MSFTAGGAGAGGKEVLPGMEEVTEAGQGLSGLLEAALSHIGSLGAGHRQAVEDVQHLRERLASESFNLAVLGQFKRGKSTFLNALLGIRILPTSVVPLTAIPTFLRWGPGLAVRITFMNDRAEETLSASDPGEVTSLLERFVTEEANPANSLQVLQAEVACPAPILARGLVLIDTPGIGSTYQHNTETTLNFLPRCDAALFLVSADPPVTEVELAFLKEVRGKVARLFFLFNKMDYLREKEREQALAFFRQVLADHVGLGGDVPVFPLSARDGLDARLAGDDDLLAVSGLPEVQEHLVEFLMNEKARVLHGALARKAADIVGEVHLQQELSIRSLQMPLKNLEERMGILEGRIEEARGQRRTAADLLAGDRKRAMELLERQAGQLRGKAREHLEAVVTGALTGASGRSSIQSRAHAALADAIPGFFEHELGTFSREFDRHVFQVLGPHRKRADELVEAVRRAAAELFEIPYDTRESGVVYEEVSQPYWVTRKWNSSFNPIPAGALDWLVPEPLRSRLVFRRLMDQVQDLVLHNVENLRWATLQNLDSAFRRFVSSLDSRLAATIEATSGAVKAAVKSRREHADDILQDLDRLLSSVRKLDDVRRQLLERAGVGTEPGTVREHESLPADLRGSS